MVAQRRDRRVLRLSIRDPADHAVPQAWPGVGAGARCNRTAPGPGDRGRESRKQRHYGLGTGQDGRLFPRRHGALSGVPADAGDQRALGELARQRGDRRNPRHQLFPWGNRLRGLCFWGPGLFARLQCRHRQSPVLRRGGDVPRADFVSAQIDPRPAIDVVTLYHQPRTCRLALWRAPGGDLSGRHCRRSLRAALVDRAAVSALVARIVATGSAAGQARWDRHRLGSGTLRFCRVSEPQKWDHFCWPSSVSRTVPAR